MSLEAHIQAFSIEAQDDDGYALHREGRAPLRLWTSDAGFVLERSDKTRVHIRVEEQTWVCSCPLGTEGSCLHIGLARRALQEDTRSAPDPRFAEGLSLASAGLLQAARSSKLRVARKGRRLIVGAASVGLQDGKITCDCPMGEDPSCLHRVIAALWSRGERAADAGGPSAARSAKHASRPGERLPFEDLERFEPILARAERLVVELVSFGVHRQGPALLERLRALAMAARALGVREGAPRHAGLGRLIRALEALTTRLEELGARIVTTTELDVLRVLGVIRNLIRALRANAGVFALAEIAGAPQLEYHPVPALDVQGLGLSQWVTPTGFAGVTAYVIDLRNGRVLTRTNTLPRESAEAGVSALYSDRSWAEPLANALAFGGTTVRYVDLATKRHLLSRAQISEGVARLSGSGKTQAALRNPIPLDDERLRSLRLEGPQDVVRLASTQLFDPLGRPPAAPSLGLLAVDTVEPSHFDPTTQTLYTTIHGGNGLRLPVRIAYRSSRDSFFDNVDRLAALGNRLKWLLVQLRLEEGHLSAEPVTAWIEPPHERLRPYQLTYEPLDTFGALIP